MGHQARRWATRGGEDLPHPLVCVIAAGGADDVVEEHRHDLTVGQRPRRRPAPTRTRSAAGTSPLVTDSSHPVTRPTGKPPSADPTPGPEWADTPQARIKYDEQNKGWTLYWSDRKSRAHRDDLLEPDQPIERLLAEYDEDPTCIFKG